MGLASKLHDHQQQMTILDQTKTLSESALQMLYAAKEGGGNPKVLIPSCSYSMFSLLWGLIEVCVSKLNTSDTVVFNRKVRILENQAILYCCISLLHVLLSYMSYALNRILQNMLVGVFTSYYDYIL